MEKACKSNNYHYNKSLQKLSKKNKRSLNKSEAMMWRLLKAGNIKGYKFRRQRPILNYIVDFCCLELMLIIEVDGITHFHDDSIKEDNIRDGILKQVGFSIIRFDALEVMNKPDEVVMYMEEWMEKYEK